MLEREIGKRKRGEGEWEREKRGEWEREKRGDWERERESDCGGTRTSLF